MGRRRGCAWERCNCQPLYITHTWSAELMPGVGGLRGPDDTKAIAQHPIYKRSGLVVSTLGQISTKHAGEEILPVTGAMQFCLEQHVAFMWQSRMVRIVFRLEYFCLREPAHAGCGCV